MALIALSKAEKTFILHGVEDDFRVDGRSRREYRPMELETGLVSNASGSARLRLANTDILIGVKMEIDKPEFETPDLGKIEFFVDCSANATPQFEGRGGESLAVDLAETMARLYRSQNAMDLKALCILEGQQCWKLYVDILILECGGNLYDAVSLATKAALHNTRLPHVTAEIMDAGETDLVLSDDPFNCTRLSVDKLPILVTMCKIGDSLVVDPSAEEEECSTGSSVLAVAPLSELNCSTSTHTMGNGTLHEDSLCSSIEIANEVGKRLNSMLLKTLAVEEQQRAGKRHEAVGFLK